MPEREDFEGWLRLRSTLWPECSPALHELEMGNLLGDADRAAVFVAADEGALVGFVEVALRHVRPRQDRSGGCDTSPLGYVEGFFVRPEARGRGIGRSLLRAAEAWAADRGCRRMGSDAAADDDAARLLHESLGYEAGESVAHFYKAIVPLRVESAERPAEERG